LSRISARGKFFGREMTYKALRPLFVGFGSLRFQDDLASENDQKLLIRTFAPKHMVARSATINGRFQKRGRVSGAR